MPKFVRVGPNPNFRPEKGQEAQWAIVKAQYAKSLPYVTAMENVKNSGGMYVVLPDEAAPGSSASPGIRLPEEMTKDELVLTALQLGIDMSKKQMKKAELAKAVRLQLDAVQLLPDDDEEGSGAE